jgi:DNA-binding MarR family transcriptional regulator
MPNDPSTGTDPGPAAARAGVAARGAARLESGLGFRLSRLARTLRAIWAAELAEHGLTPPQAAVLRALADRPGSSLRALARTLGAEPMRAKRCVDELEARQLLTSEHEREARRSRALRLTPQGTQLAATVSRLVQRQEAHLARALGPKRRGALEDACKALEDAFDLSAPPERSTGAKRAADRSSSPRTSPTTPDKEAR